MRASRRRGYSISTCLKAHVMVLWCVISGQFRRWRHRQFIVPTATAAAKRLAGVTGVGHPPGHPAATPSPDRPLVGPCAPVGCVGSPGSAPWRRHRCSDPPTSAIIDATADIFHQSMPPALRGVLARQHPLRKAVARLTLAGRVWMTGAACPPGNTATLALPRPVVGAPGGACGCFPAGICWLRYYFRDEEEETVRTNLLGLTTDGGAVLAPGVPRGQRKAPRRTFAQRVASPGTLPTTTPRWELHASAATVAVARRRLHRGCEPPPHGLLTLWSRPHGQPGPRDSA